MKCAQCGSTSGFGWVKNEVVCSKCKHEGTMEEFGCVHCEEVTQNERQGVKGFDEPTPNRSYYWFNGVKVPTTHSQCTSEDTLVKIEQGLGGVDEANVLRAELETMDQKFKLQGATTELKVGLSVDMVTSLRGQLATLQRSLDWERECSRQAEEEITEARYWARRLYQATYPCQSESLRQSTPEWVTWVDDQKNA